MKKIIILGLGVVGIALNSAILLADSDAHKYPATDFQPKVIFIDKDAAIASPKKVEFDPKFPAANFQPKVLYSDKNTTDSNK